MCDRSKAEVLSREFAIVKYRSKGLKGDQLHHLVDKHWRDFLKQSHSVIETLKAHS